MRLPFKLAIQPIYPIRTIDQNAYLFGVVYKLIADYTGHTTDEIHEAYKDKFNVDYVIDKKDPNKWVLTRKSSTVLTTIEFSEFTERVRIDAEIELRLTIPLPDEVFSSELKFEDD